VGPQLRLSGGKAGPEKLSSDVPSPIDFHDPVQARAWEADTVERRPWRPQFFAAFASVLQARFNRPITVLELGSGPGHLAEHLLTQCAIDGYVALDFSAAMHEIARERLSLFLDKVEFAVRDFRQADWGEGLGQFDAVVTLQAAHETRHIRHLPGFLSRAQQRLAPGGLFLYCDHYLGVLSNADLYLAAEEQPLALAAVGFHNVQKRLDIGGMALFSADKPGPV
jgi:SAM-dependent methyltransferase